MGQAQAEFSSTLIDTDQFDIELLTDLKYAVHGRKTFPIDLGNMEQASCTPHGSNLRISLRTKSPHTLRIRLALMFVRRFLCVSTTPLGSAVDPDEN